VDCRGALGDTLPDPLPPILGKPDTNVTCDRQVAP
jgi:hypothetical protein